MKASVTTVRFLAETRIKGPLWAPSLRNGSICPLELSLGRSLEEAFVFVFFPRTGGRDPARAVMCVLC